MFFGTREEEAQRLHEEALARLDEGDVAGARACAAELRAMRWSGAFEIEALAARAEGDLESALRALEEGVRLAPSAWSLRALLGNLYATAGRLADALATFDAALRCEGAWVSSIRYNRAVARMNAGDPGGALADAESVLEDPATPPFTLDALRIAIDALAALGRAADAVALVGAMAGSVPASDPRGRAELQAFRALVIGRAGGALAEVRAAIELAIDGGATRPELFEALALVPGDGEGTARYSVRISAPPPEGAPDEVAGYLRVIEVRARDEAQAIAIARSVEPASTRSRIAIEECRVLGPDEGPARALGGTGRALFGH